MSYQHANMTCHTMPLQLLAGNPEEGELRPQLLDRFGMHAQIGTVKDPELRVQIVSERSTFDENPAEFHKKYADKQVGDVRRLPMFGFCVVLHIVTHQVVQGVDKPRNMLDE